MSTAGDGDPGSHGLVAGCRMTCGRRLPVSRSTPQPREDAGKELWDSISDSGRGARYPIQRYTTSMATKMTPDSDVLDHLPWTPLWFQVLIALLDGKQHGYGIIKEIEVQGGHGKLRLAPSTWPFNACRSGDSYVPPEPSGRTPARSDGCID